MIAMCWRCKSIKTEPIPDGESSTAGVQFVAGAGPPTRMIGCEAVPEIKSFAMAQAMCPILKRGAQRGDDLRRELNSFLRRIITSDRLGIRGLGNGVMKCAGCGRSNDDNLPDEERDGMSPAELSRVEIDHAPSCLRQDAIALVKWMDEVGKGQKDLEHCQRVAKVTVKDFAEQHFTGTREQKLYREGAGMGMSMLISELQMAGLLPRETSMQFFQQWDSEYWAIIEAEPKESKA